MSVGRATPWGPDVDDLTRSLNQIEAEYRADLDSLLVCRLVDNLNRGCPVRTVGAAPARDTLRLGFANGLSVIAHCAGGGLLRLLVPLRAGISVVLDRITRTDEGVEVSLRWPHHRLDVIITGFDQTD